MAEEPVARAGEGGAVAAEVDGWDDEQAEPTVHDEEPAAAPVAPAARPPAAERGARIPPPPDRRDRLLDHRAQRLGRHRDDARRSTPRLHAGRIAAVVVLVLVAALIWFLVSLFQPFSGKGHGVVVVDIPHGSGASTVGKLLASRGVVASGFFFNLRAAIDGDRGGLHSGVYTMRHDMSYAAAIDELLHEPPPPPEVKVLIVEGQSRREIAAVARADNLTGSYLAASVRSPLLNPTSYGAPAHTPSLEGFLFPATYDLKVGADARRLVDEQLVAFQQNFGASEVAAARRQHVTPYGLLIVASMVQREAGTTSDGPKIAAVIYNRLRIGMPLGIDAVIRYALGDKSSDLTESDLHINSPYNDRTHTGLPPTPIGNPGLAAIEAAAHPASEPYLYYVAAADGCGEQAFSTTFSAFERNEAA